MSSSEDECCDSGSESLEARDDSNDEEEEEEQDMGMDLCKDPSTSPAEMMHEDDFRFEVLSTDMIVAHMSDSIQEVRRVVQIPATIVRILLNFFKWDKDKMMERFYSDSQEKMFADAKVVSPFRRAQHSKPTASLSHACSAGSATDLCEICYQTIPRKMMTGLECGHTYCTACWVEYLTTRIMNDGAGQMIECPGACDILVDDVTVMSLLQDPQVKLKYQHLITNSFVQCNRLLRWCPSPNCDCAIKASQVEAKPVLCKCSHLFCFACSENWHDPVLCHVIKKWIKKCEDDSATLNWISVNTKECPKCHAAIEKNGGCNHMTCKNVACGFHFCWVCLGPWEKHANYNCNRYDDEASKSARSEQEKSRAALERYLFYCNRYMNHLKSLKFENKLYSTIKEKMEEMQQQNMTWIEVQFLKKAVDILCECRRTLMYTYVFAYYLKKNNQSEMFEANQNDLEISAETLSECLEKQVSIENWANIKQKVQDLYRYCDGRRKVLLDHVHEGYEKEWWIDTDSDGL